MKYQHFKLEFAAGAEPHEPVTVATVASVAASGSDFGASQARPRSAPETSLTVPKNGSTRDSPDGRSSDRAPATVATLATVLAVVPKGQRDAGLDFWLSQLAILDPGRPTAGFGPERWQQLLQDARRFLQAWATRAAELGWTTLDLFGVNPAAPAVRQDSKGLVPLLGGGEVIDMRSDRATIRMSSGNCLTYYLRMPKPDAVAIWELASDRRHVHG